MYLSAFAWKTVGTDWINGTALFYTTRLVQLQRFPAPALENGLLLRFMTWFVLFTELAVGAMVWFRKFRYRVLLLGVGFHLSIEYAMNIPLFQWVILAGYVTFIDPADLSRAWAWVCKHFATSLGEPVEVIYDGSSLRSVRLVNVFRVGDIFDRLRFVDRDSTQVATECSDSLQSEHQTCLCVSASGSMERCFTSLLAVSRVVPLLWWLVPASVISRWKHVLPGSGSHC